MIKRPTSISVISWFLIVTGLISVITTTAMINNPMAQNMMAKSPMPISIQYAMSYFGLLVMIVSGIAMLKGRNWARYLYVIWSFIGFVIGMAISPMKAAMIPGFVVLLVVTFFLFRPKATAFFVTREEPEHA